LGKNVGAIKTKRGKINVTSTVEGVRYATAMGGGKKSFA